MECIYPMLIKPKPWSTPIQVPCGQCIACRLNRASEWAVRIMHEKKMSGSASFVTLTYDQEHCPWVSDSSATLVKKDVQNFLKRLRRIVVPIKIRYYLCGEYGEHGQRPHYHLIIFGLSPEECDKFVPQAWTYGMIHVGDVTYDSACYVARYCTKLLTGNKKIWYEERNLVPEFSLMSRKPGIGASWLAKYGQEIKTHHSVVVKGKKMSPPRYYRDKVYDEVDRNIVRSLNAPRKVAQKKQEMKDDDHDWKYGTHLGWDRRVIRERTIKSKLKKRS